MVDYYQFHGHFYTRDSYYKNFPSTFSMQKNKIHTISLFYHNTYFMCIIILVLHYFPIRFHYYILRFLTTEHTLALPLISLPSFHILLRIFHNIIKDCFYMKHINLHFYFYMS